MYHYSYQLQHMALIRLYRRQSLAKVSSGAISPQAFEAVPRDIIDHQYANRHGSTWSSQSQSEGLRRPESLRPCPQPSPLFIYDVEIQSSLEALVVELEAHAGVVILPFSLSCAI